MRFQSPHSNNRESLYNRNSESERTSEYDRMPIKKLRHEVIFKMNDGNIYFGRIFVGLQERVLDILNDARHFIPMELENKQVLIVAKDAITAIDIFERTSEQSMPFENNPQESSLFKCIAIQNQESKLVDAVNKIASLNREPKNHNKEIEEHYTQIVDMLNHPLFTTLREINQEFNLHIEKIINHIQSISKH